MDPRQHAHWIAGQPVEAQSGWGQSLRAACEPWSQLGPWPLTGAEELEQALGVLASAAQNWSAVPAPERQDRVALWVSRMAAANPDWSELGLALGFEQRSGWGADLEIEPLARQLDLELERPRSARGPLALVAVDWSELGGGLVRAVASALQAGRGVLLLSDPRTPMAADLVHELWMQAGLPPGLLALFHGLPGELLERLAMDARVGDLLASSREPKRLRAWRAWSARAGLVAPELRLLRSAQARVGEQDDVRRSARRILRAAFDPGATLFGQAAGQVGQVHCHRAQFSAFTEALLCELQESGMQERALPLIDQAALDAWSERWGHGLDEGATLIAGGERFSARPNARDWRVLPTLLTNVEPHMLAARSAMALPVLCLLRAD